MSETPNYPKQKLADIVAKIPEIHHAEFLAWVEQTASDVDDQRTIAEVAALKKWIHQDVSSPDNNSGTNLLAKAAERIEQKLIASGFTVREWESDSKALVATFVPRRRP